METPVSQNLPKHQLASFAAQLHVQLASGSKRRTQQHACLLRVARLSAQQTVVAKRHLLNERQRGTAFYGRLTAKSSLR
jgi:hypothetical protein